MYKLVVLLSVVAMAAANPGFVAPVPVATIVPGGVSTSAYSSSLVHSPALYRAPLFTPPYPVLTPGVIATPFHHLHKRSPGYAPLSGVVVSPVTYTSPVVSTYPAPFVGSHFGYSPLYTRPLGVLPY